MRVSMLVAVVGLAGAVGLCNAEVITLRSGQVGGLPGVAGQPDDIVTFLNNNPPGAAISATPFTAADFSGARRVPRRRSSTRTRRGRRASATPWRAGSTSARTS